MQVNTSQHDHHNKKAQSRDGWQTENAGRYEQAPDQHNVDKSQHA